jgi:hypothetical protein
MEVKKKVLFVVSDYLPNRSGGTLRVEKNLKYISAKIDSFVFTQELNRVGKYEMIDGVEVFRTNAYDLGTYYVKLKYFVQRKLISSSTNNLTKYKSPVRKGRLADKYFVPDIDMIWAFLCFWKLSRIIRLRDIDVVYSSAPAASNHLITLFAKFLVPSKVKWIAEFRDPWITNPFRNRKAFPFENIDHFMEGWVLNKCDKIIVTSEKYKTDFLSRYASLESNKICFIPNGYDSADFEFLKNIQKIENPIYTILSIGNYYEKRSLLPFLLSWKLAMNKISETKREIQFIHYGNIDVMAAEFLNANKLKNVTINKAIPHSQCIYEIYQADCLLLVPGPGDGTMPGKTFEYLATGNPILALVDEGPAKALINELKAGVTISVNDKEKIEIVLIALLKGENIKINKNKIAEHIKRYDRKSLAISILNEINSI